VRLKKSGGEDTPSVLSSKSLAWAAHAKAISAHSPHDPAIAFDLGLCRADEHE
jgi:hypothetical protein